MLKSRLLKTTALSAAIAFSLTACDSGQDTSPQTSWEKDKTYHLTVLHTNDHHGHFWENKHGEFGMAARKTLIDRLRAEAQANNAAVLLLSGGDINTGVPESDLLDAEPDFKAMNMIGYDAMVMGNHEFDNPLSVLEKQIGWAEFPMLAANIYDKATATRKYQPYHIFEKNGLRIAIIGLTTEDTGKIGNPEYVNELDFRDPQAEAKTLLAEIEDRYAPDITIGLTHMGHYQNGEHGANAPGDVALARALNKGALDMIIGGHSQEPVCMQAENVSNNDYLPGEPCQSDKQNGTWVMQAFEWGKYVGKADFSFKNGELNLDSYQLIPVNLTKKVTIDGKEERVFVQPEIPKDKELHAFLETYQNQGAQLLNVKVASIDAKLEGDRNKVRFEQTNLGRLIGAAHMERAQADFAVMNSGGVRASIEAGDITYNDILKVQPFGNIVSYVDMTGAEILDYLNVVATKPVDTGAYAQFYGISMQVEKDRVSNVVIGGAPLDVNKSYRFSVPSYNAAGGDGYPNILQHKNYVNTKFVDAEVLKAFLEKHSPIKVSDYNFNNEISYKN